MKEHRMVSGGQPAGFAPWNTVQFQDVSVLRDDVVDFGWISEVSYYFYLQVYIYDEQGRPLGGGARRRHVLLDFP